MQRTFLALALLTGTLPQAASAAQPVAWYEQPAPTHYAHHASSAERPWWKRTLIYRQWLPRYTIREGTHYVRPYDYHRAFDYPWHEPRVPHPLVATPISSGPPVVDLMPPPALSEEQFSYPDIDLPPATHAH